MVEDHFFTLIDPIMKGSGSVPEEGEDYRTPPLDVLRYYRRPVRLHWLPFFGRGLSVVAVVRQPVNLGFSTGELRTLLDRIASAADTRFPAIGRGRHPWALALGLTVVLLTPEPIGPADDATLASAVDGRPLPRRRSVPLGIIRVNLGQEAMSFALASSPDDVFTEPAAIADTLTPHFRRYVPYLEV